MGMGPASWYGGLTMGMGPVLWVWGLNYGVWDQPYGYGGLTMGMGPALWVWGLDLSELTLSVCPTKNLCTLVSMSMSMIRLWQA